MKIQKLKLLVAHALKEDMPRGDVTTEPIVSPKTVGKAYLVAKQELILAGSEPFEFAFKLIDRNCKTAWNYNDGDRIKNGEVICTLKGRYSAILKAERTALNFLGHLSGVATLTSLFVEKTSGTYTKITDTRKTLPGLRELEKQAVLLGGGVNHRMGLSDAVLIKENHIRAAGGIGFAVEKVRKKHPRLPIEVEVTNPSEIDEAIGLRVQRLLLDNMSLDEMAAAMKKISGRCLVEASGNMTLDRIEDVAKLGVHFISVGQLTHSAPSADVSLLFEETT